MKSTSNLWMSSKLYLYDEDLDNNEHVKLELYFHNRKIESSEDECVSIDKQQYFNLWIKSVEK